jgi:hypothetical protein
MKPPEFRQAECFFFNLEKVGRDFILSGKEFHTCCKSENVFEIETICLLSFK